MKLFHTLLIAMLVLCTKQAQAQTMKVYTGPVITAIPSTTAGDIEFAPDRTFTVMGNHFRIADVDQIIVDRSSCPTQSVQVEYKDNQAQVIVSGDVAPLLDINVTGAHVRILADTTSVTEVKYILSGTSNNGSFYMDGKYKAGLMLYNLNLTNPDSAAINIACGKRIEVCLPAGTTTTLSDGPNKLNKACFFIDGHAEFIGSGTLNLSGKSHHAYASNEYTWFKPEFGTLNITSAEGDGLHVEQFLRIESGQINISNTKGDCIDVKGKLRRILPDNGKAFISGGHLNLQVTADDTKGLKCDSVMTITGGSITANVAGNGCKGLSAGTDLFLNNSSGTNPQIEMEVSGTTYMPRDPILESKCRGIKVKRNFIFDGGNIHMNVTGSKAKGISVDGIVNYISGTSNVYW